MNVKEKCAGQAGHHVLTTFEDVYETHEERAKLLAVEGVLLRRDVHFNPSGGNVIQQHSYQLEQEPAGQEVTKGTKVSS